jgi:hypothetical protein
MSHPSTVGMYFCQCRECRLYMTSSGASDQRGRYLVHATWSRHQANERTWSYDDTHLASSSRQISLTSIPQSMPLVPQSMVVSA